MRSMVLWLNAPLAWGIFLLVSAINVVTGSLLQLMALPWDPERRMALQVNHWLWGRALFAAEPGWHATWEGLEELSHGPYIVVANHSSVLDIPICIGLPIPIRVLAKNVLTRVPIMGWYLRFSGQIPVDVRDTASVERAMARCVNTLRADISVLVFPEGTRTDDARVTTFGRGAFRLAKDTGVQILPVAIHGTHRIMRKGRLLPQSISQPLRVRVLPPIDPAGFSTARKLSNQVQALLRDEVEAMRTALNAPVEVFRGL